MRLAPLILLVACATAPPPPTPKLTEVPRGVLDAFCSQLRTEGISVETAMNVVSTTQPIITPDSIAGLADAAFTRTAFDAIAIADEANHAAAPIPVVVPQGGCAWHAVAEGARHAGDVMTIELSSPFRNPFERNSFGLIARLSLANEAATWYWVPLGEREGRWAAGRPMLLGLR